MEQPSSRPSSPEKNLTANPPVEFQSSDTTQIPVEMPVSTQKSNPPIPEPKPVGDVSVPGIQYQRRGRKASTATAEPEAKKMPEEWNVASEGPEAVKEIMPEGREVEILEEVDSPKEDDRDIPVLKVPFMKGALKGQQNMSEDEEDDEATESDNSAEMRARVERRSKERSDPAVQKRAAEIKKKKEMAAKKEEEAFLAAEKKRKGKGLAPPPLRRSRRTPSKTVIIKERAEDQPPVDISSSDEEEILHEGSREGCLQGGFGMLTVEVGDHTKKIVSSFDDEEDKEIYALKANAAVRNRVHQVIALEELNGMEIKKNLFRQLIRVGLGWFVQLGDVSVPLMLAEEFFTTFRFAMTTDLDKISVSFRLLGLDWEMNLVEWAVRLGVVSNADSELEQWRKSERGVPGKSVQFDGKKEWRLVARKGTPVFEANKSFGDDIADPLLRLAQVYIGYNLLGQGSCVSRVSLTELYFMRRIQDGVGVNLGFWLAYQSHQINRSKTRHLNLCHIVGVFLRNNLEMIHARQGLQFEMCMSPRPFDLKYLLENKIIREVAGGYAFYEPGKAAPKLRTRVVLQGTDEQVAKEDDDRETVGWLVNAHLDLERKVDMMYGMIHDMWMSFKKEQKEKEVAKEAETDEVEESKETSDQEDKDDPEEAAEEAEEQEEQETEETVAGRILAGMDEHGKRELVKLAVQAVLMSSKETAEKKKVAGASAAKPKISQTVPKRKRDPPQRSSEGPSLRSKRRR